MTITKELITPDIAKKYLASNSQNRKIKNPVLYRYAQDMANHSWREDTGELIKLSKEGVLLDGQHRLAALIRANVSLNFHVAKNCDHDIIEFIDTGSKRNAPDLFTMEGIKKANTIPSIISTYNLFKRGYSLQGAQKHFRSTNYELLHQYNANEMFWQAIAAKAHNWYLSFAKILPPSMVGGIYAFFYSFDEDQAESFMEQLSTGINVSNRAISLLRQKLMIDKAAPRKMPILMKYALIIKAWNCYRKNDTLKVLKFDSIRDNYPLAI